MNKHGLYQVTGRRAYRGHAPGTTFEAVLDRASEARAVARGDIRLIRRVTPSLAPGSWRLPAGWPPDKPDVAPTTSRGRESGPFH